MAICPAATERTNHTSTGISALLPSFRKASTTM